MTTKANRVCGFVLLSVSILSLVGWSYKIQAAVSWFPGLVPMQPNAALLFLLAGVSLIFNLQHFIPSFILAVAGITLCSDLGVTSELQLDSLLTEDPFITIQTPNPGRMAINTSFGFVLFALQYFLPSKPARWCIETGLVVSVIATIGYLTGYTSMYRWSPTVTAMALNTAVCFDVLFGFLMYNLYREAACEVESNPTRIGTR